MHYICSFLQETCTPRVRCFSNGSTAAVVPVAAAQQPQTHHRQDELDTQTDRLTAGDKKLPQDMQAGSASSTTMSPEASFSKSTPELPGTLGTHYKYACVQMNDIDRLTSAHSEPKTIEQQCSADTTHRTTQASHSHHRSTALPLI